jgi:hypothetical protein
MYLASQSGSQTASNQNGKEYSANDMLDFFQIHKRETVWNPHV